MLDPDVCYRALSTRDARFDGRFFTAVRSTGVFCRPVCPARTPRRENCWFVACAAAAREAGFRPCLRCRPEASPGTPAWLGTSSTVSRALRLIDGGALDAGSVGDLAARLGVGDRHLRRLFLRHLGATPVAVAQTRRLLFAKKLIDETGLSMTEVSQAAGFSSLRRFNAAVLDAYGRPPRELRRRGRDEACRHDGPSEIVLRLSYRPPFDWATLSGFLALRATPGIECVSDGVYHRSVEVGDARGTVEVRPAAKGHHLEATIRLSHAAGLSRVAQGLRRVFDLGADPEAIRAQLARDRRLRPLLRKRPGLRVPGAWDGFELAVRAILGQQVSVKGATTLAGRLVARFGAPLDSADSDAEAPLVDRLFPAPATLAEADLRTIGMPTARARALSGLAAAVAAGELALDPAADPDTTRARLEELPGVGPWTAQYIAMRALGAPDAFPASDLGLLKAWAERSGQPVQAPELEAVSERWRPWRAYAALHLWSSLA